LKLTINQLIKLKIFYILIQSRNSFARGVDSDHVALLNAYEGWVESLWTGNEREYISKNFLHRGTLTMIQGKGSIIFVK